MKSVKEEAISRQENPVEKARLNRRRRKLEKALEKQESLDLGLDIQRENALDYSIEETEAWREKMIEKNQGKDTGFTDYHQLALRKYKKLIHQMKPDLSAYYLEKLQSSSNVSSGATDFLSHQPKKEKVNEMVEDLHNQLQVRKKFSKRRKHNEDGDVTFINERNAKFNKKINRAYDEYTQEYRASLERGSAV